MTSIADQNRIRELERKQTELETRIDVLERVSVLVDATDHQRRGPGRPRKLPDAQPTND